MSACPDIETLVGRAGAGQVQASLAAGPTAGLGPRASLSAQRHSETCSACASVRCLAEQSSAARCARFEPLIARYLAGALRADESERVGAHLATCERCTELCDVAAVLVADGASESAVEDVRASRRDGARHAHALDEQPLAPARRTRARQDTRRVVPAWSAVAGAVLAAAAAFGVARALFPAQSARDTSEPVIASAERDEVEVAAAHAARANAERLRASEERARRAEEAARSAEARLARLEGAHDATTAAPRPAGSMPSPRPESVNARPSPPPRERATTTAAQAPTARGAARMELVAGDILAPPADAQSLSDGVVRRVLGQSAGRMRACASAAPRDAALLDGYVIVAFDVGVDGRVSHADASGDMPQAVLSCVERALAGLAFPPQPEEGSVVYSLEFSAVAQD